LDNFRNAFAGIDQAGVLTKRKRGIVDITGASAAVLGVWVRVQFGDYQYAFLNGGCLGLVAACLALTIRRTERGAPGMPAATQLAGGNGDDLLEKLTSSML